MKAKIQEKFQSLFGGHGEIYMSAGRVNLIGEHTDYNGGYVFPGSINFGIMLEIRPNGTDTAKVLSIDMNDYAEFKFEEKAISITPSGTSVPKGVYIIDKKKLSH